MFVERAAALATLPVGAQIVALVVAGVTAWLLHHRWDRYLQVMLGDGASHGLRKLVWQSTLRLVFPVGMLLMVLVGRAILAELGWNVALLDVVVPLLLSLAGIRVLVYVLRKGFGPSRALKAWEHIISTTIWLIVALHLVGWLPGVLNAMDELGVTIGANRVSLLAVFKLVLSIAVLVVISMWLSRTLEKKVMGSPHLDVGMRVALAKVSRFFLLTLAVLIALNSVGIDLTALTVFGGALGVGLGFGLQRIASNIVSGFILVFDRSIRPGDVISIGDSFGWVRELRARYVVVRSRDGVETLIPNENLITSEVINWSYSDRNIRVKIPVQISYGDDPERAMALMLECASASSRVIDDPPPVCRLMEFGDNGIGLELRVWIEDPEAGVGGVRSDINLAIWRAFKGAGVTIPYPQRDIYLKSLPDSELPVSGA